MSLRSSVPAALVLSAVSSQVFAQWTPNAWQTHRLGYTDSIHTRSDGQQQALVRGVRLERDGLLVGVSERYRGLDLVGASAWASTLTSPLQRIGFFDAVHTSSAGDQFSEAGGAVGLAASATGSVNALGQTIGYSTRYDGSLESGSSAWLWDPALGTRRLGPTGGIFEGPAGEAFARPVSFDDAGRVIGTAQRYGDALLSNNVPAASAWFQSPGSAPIILDLTGPEFVREIDGYQRHDARSMNNAGLVVGVSQRFDATDSPAGQTAWRWTPATGTQRVGPQGSRYTTSSTFEYAYVVRPTAGGDVVGASWTFLPGTSEIGRDTWIVRAGVSSAQVIGLRGPDHTRFDGLQFGEPTALRLEGPLRVAGFARLFLDQGNFFDGRSSWSWTPSEGTIEIGLRDAQHQTSRGERDSFPFATLPNGCVAGYAERLGSSIFDRTGQSAWVWSPPTASAPQGVTRRIGIFDALHTSSDGFQRSEIYGTTDAGQIFGVSYRYNGRSQFDNATGRTMWVYDTTTNTQTALVFSTSNTNDAAGLPLGMTSDGVLYGYYLEYQGVQIVAQRAFVWSASRGVSTVNALLSGGPFAQTIENAFFTSEFADAAGLGVLYAMPRGILWDPQGGGWATAYRLVRAGGSACDGLDFNNDTLTPDSQDLDDFLAVLAGGPSACSTFPTPGCNDIDFNNDELAPDACDLEAFITVLSGGGCTPCGQ